MKLCFDESGDWGTLSQRYFVIGGFASSDILKVRSTMRKALKKVRKTFPSQQNLPEIKASGCPVIAKDYVLRIIAKQNINVFYMVIDKNHVPEAIRLGKAQNRFVNYQMGIILCQIVNTLNLPAFDCLIDERTISVGSLNSLEDYVFIKLNCEQNRNVGLSVKYGLSHQYFELQAADFIANAFWTAENFNCTYFSNLLSPLAPRRLIFPISKFGT